MLLSSLTLIGFAPSEQSPRIRREQLQKYEEIKIQYQKYQQLELFLHDIAYIESRNNPLIVNSQGYIGLFQFGKQARKAVGHDYIKQSDIIFNKQTNKLQLKDSTIWTINEQKHAMISLMQKHELALFKYIVQTPFIFNHHTITKSGILAAAHLAGQGNVLKFFETHGAYNPHDSNGTYLSDYLYKFSGYNF